MNLKTDLIPHQVPAVEKMLPTRIGALFMDMGTGKTRTAIEVIHRRLSKVSQVIWFCPVSLKETIRQEILKHTDSQDIHCFSHTTGTREIPKAFWYIVGIESMSLSRRIIFAISALVDVGTFVIVDESSYIKGHNSARTCWITQLSQKARYRMILTGTAISQGVVDLFAQLRFLSPKILGYASFYSFAANHLEYSDRFPGKIVRSHNTEWIAAKIAPYVYQVTKEECLNLPDKLYETRYFHMTWEQRDVYEQVKAKAFEIIEEWNSYSIFQLFTRLQQIVCGFLNVWKIEFEHRRLALLHSLVEEITENEKIIIWCKYEYDIKEITQVLGQENTALFYGKIPARKRQAQIDRFRGQARFFVATQSCGGHGLTLNEANHVIYYNNGFKYAERIQSEDRCHRIGQTQPVTYVDIVCSDSIDERIKNALWSKGSLVDDFRSEVAAVKDCAEGIKNLIKEL